MEKKTIYIADDEKAICELLDAHLTAQGYIAKTFPNGKDLLDAFYQKPCDMIITDMMMPHMNGYELCREVRQTSDIPIFIISAKDEELDRVLGLELGSDDYISKPFSLREVTAKIQNMFSRLDKMNAQNKDELVLKDLVLMKNNRTVYINGQELAVTTKEFDLLKLFIENKNRAFSREEIIENVWGYDYYGNARQVDHAIKRLRKKMLLMNARSQIETVWGFGYKITDFEET